MRHLTATLLALTLAACKTTPGPVEIKTVEVRVPVTVACVRKDQIPTMPPRVGEQLQGDAQADASLLAASAIRLRSTLGVALALLDGCAG